MKKNTLKINFIVICNNILFIKDWCMVLVNLKTKILDMKDKDRLFINISKVFLLYISKELLIY